MPTAKREETKELLSHISFFKAMCEEDQKTLLKNATFKDYPKHASIYTQGDKADRFLIIIKGWVKLYSVTADGKEIIATLLTKGDILGEDFLFSNQSRFFSATAIDDDTVLAEISSTIVKKLVMTNPAMITHVMTSMTNKIQSLRIENGNRDNMDAPQRLSCLLLRLSSWMTGKGGSFPLPYDKSVMAAQLGIEPATFSRALEKIKDKGVTYKGSEIHIKDFSPLSEYCCIHCPIPEGECDGRRISNTKKCSES